MIFYSFPIGHSKIVKKLLQTVEARTAGSHRKETAPTRAILKRRAVFRKRTRKFISATVVENRQFLRLKCYQSERQAEADLIWCLNIKPSAIESPVVGKWGPPLQMPSSGRPFSGIFNRGRKPACDSYSMRASYLSSKSALDTMKLHFHFKFSQQACQAGKSLFSSGITFFTSWQVLFPSPVSSPAPYTPHPHHKHPLHLPFPFFLPYPPLLPPITHNFLPVELWMPVKCKKLPGASLPSAILIQLDFPPPPSTRPPKVIAAADRLKTLLGGPVQRLGWNNFCASLSFSVITSPKLPFDRKSFANTGAGPALRSDHWRSWTGLVQAQELPLWANQESDLRLSVLVF